MRHGRGPAFYKARTAVISATLGGVLITAAIWGGPKLVAAVQNNNQNNSQTNTFYICSCQCCHGKQREQIQPNESPIPTHQPMPTNQPMPTYQPTPTYQPVPTYQPIPTSQPTPPPTSQPTTQPVIRIEEPEQPVIEGDDPSEITIPVEDPGSFIPITTDPIYVDGTRTSQSGQNPGSNDTPSGDEFIRIEQQGANLGPNQ